MPPTEWSLAKYRVGGPPLFNISTGMDCGVPRFETRGKVGTPVREVHPVCSFSFGILAGAFHQFPSAFPSFF